MDFQESEAFMKENEAKQKRKRMVILGMVLCLITIAFLGCFIIYFKHVDQVTFKMFINNKKYSTSKSFLVEDEDNKGEYYVNLEELCSKADYLFQEGSVSITEGENLYSITTNYEKIDLDISKMTFDKYLYEDTASIEKRSVYESDVYGTDLVIRTPKDTREIFQLNKPLKKINGMVYISKEDIPKVLSYKVDWNNQYRLYLSSVHYLYKYYTPTVTKAGYTTMSGDYENIRAMLDGYLIVEKNNKYGVITTDSKVIIEAKFDRLFYSQNSMEFFAYANSKVGLIEKDGKQLISPSKYQNISIFDQNLDQEHRLYLVSLDGKVGVVNRHGEELIHPLYEQVGLDSSIELYSKLNDAMILYDKFIPVKQDNRWGYYNLETAELGGTDNNSDKLTLAGFGCDISSSKTSSKQKSVVLIPPEIGIKGVVIMYQSELYGIYDCNVDRLIVPFVWSKIYSDTDNKTGVTSYFMESPTGEKVDLKQFLIDNNLVSETGEEKEKEVEESSSSSSFTEEMNNLSTQGKLGDTSNEDEQYFENLDNTSDSESRDEESNETGNTEDTNEETTDGEEQANGDEEV